MSSLVGSEQQAEDLSRHHHHSHHAEMRALAAPSPPNQALCCPRGHCARQGRRRKLGPPPQRLSPLHAPRRPGAPICNSQRSRRVGMKGETLGITLEIETRYWMRTTKKMSPPMMASPFVDSANVSHRTPGSLHRNQDPPTPFTSIELNMSHENLVAPLIESFITFSASVNTMKI
jgi:hypothetical protein